MTAANGEDWPDPDDSVGDGHPDLPMTGIDVQAHVHRAMTGSFPLRIAEFFFATDGLYLVEYSYITPFFGLLSRQGPKDAKVMLSIYHRDGIDGVILTGDRLHWFNYGMIDRAVLHTGGWFGNPKFTLYARDGQSYAYRLKDEDTGFDEIESDLLNCADDAGFDLEIRDGLGFNPWENIVRFFVRR